MSNFLVMYWYIPFIFFCLIAILAEIDNPVVVSIIIIPIGIIISSVFLVVRYFPSLKDIVLYSVVVYIPGVFLTGILSSVVSDLYMEFIINHSKKKHSSKNY